MAFQILVLVHVVSSLIWGAGAILSGFFLIPAMLEAGQAGGEVMGGMMKRGYSPFLGISAVLALISGLSLYYLRFSPAWLGSSEGIVLSLGGLLGLSAWFIGLTRVRPLGEKMGLLAQEGRHKEIPPVAAQLARSGKVVAWHLVAVLVLMAGHGVASLF